jgi:hypothetical protein
MTIRQEIEDRRITALRLFEALWAQYPDKYIALIQPRDPASEALEPSSASEISVARNP